MKRFYIVDAFTHEAFGGNPAGVVLLDDDAWPGSRLMEQVAAELRYSETAFVRQLNATRYELRYFTPCCEVDVCGHATIAAFGVLRHEGLVPDGARCQCNTRAGQLEVTAGDQVMMTMAPPVVKSASIDAAQLHRVIDSTNTATLWPGWPIEAVSTGLPDIILPVADVKTLNALRPDMESLSALSEQLGVVGVHAFAFGQDSFTAHVRNFAPRYGIPEEAATGTANAALTHYLRRHSLASDCEEYRFVQGEAMRRTSVVQTVVAGDGTIGVGGQYRIVAQGELMV